MTAQPSVSRAASPSAVVGAEHGERRAQSIASATPGCLSRSSSRSRATVTATERASRSETPGARSRMISTSRSSVGEVDPVVEAAPLQRVVQLARPVRGDHDRGRLVGGDRPELGHGDREVGEHLEQERLELVVGPVELVDQQHRAGAGRAAPAAAAARAGTPARTARRSARAGRARRPGARERRAAAASSPSRRAPARRRSPRSTAGGSARRRARARAPSRPRSCRRPARPRAAAAAASRAPGRQRSRARGPAGSRRRRAPARPPPRCEGHSDIVSSATRHERRFQLPIITITVNGARQEVEVEPGRCSRTSSARGSGSPARRSAAKRRSAARAPSTLDGRRSEVVHRARRPGRRLARSSRSRGSPRRAGCTRCRRRSGSSTASSAASARRG